MKLRTSLRAAVAAGLILATVGIGAGSASATEKDGWLTDGEFGLFCYKNQTNAVFDLYGSDSNFGDDFFKGSQSCANQLVDNYTESYLNKDVYAWTVYTGWAGQGYSATLPVGARGNTTSTFTNTISSAFFV
ncbi:hypothetical protein [Streptomyces sp. ISL-94]|uniref:hypothetical protein n=1 Tax=Streptomyces sp. ISL-94 TaxID=2819190 RepID=UPI001BE7F1D9|nr:hypothetical protein [Streptomyces sp. ISL-94]MBT2476703.1 hypothetical protein [Streptomyces sp. ISL-94]